MRTLTCNMSRREHWQLPVKFGQRPAYVKILLRSVLKDLFGYDTQRKLFQYEMDIIKMISLKLWLHVT